MFGSLGWEELAIVGVIVGAMVLGFAVLVVRVLWHAGKRNWGTNHRR